MREIKYLFTFFKNISLKNPKKSSVLIYDRVQSDTLIKTILTDIDYSVLPVRNEFFYLSPQIVFKMIKKIDIFPLFPIKNFISKLYRSYLMSVIEYIDPLIVVTFIDNDPMFSWLSKKYTHAQFYAIQNAIRSKSDFTELKNPDGSIVYYSLPHFICFGQNDVDEYLTYGHTIDHAHCVGSLKGSYYKYGGNYEPVKIKYDICLVSQYRIAIFQGLQHQHFKDASTKFHFFLNSFLESNPLRVCVALSAEASDDEYEYFEKMFGNKVTLIRQNVQNFMSTYAAMDSSEVIVTLNSTAALEAFGWGKKVMFCDFRGMGNYEFFHRYQFSLQKANYTEFEYKLKSLLEMKNEDFLLLTEKDRQYMMNYDPYVPVNIYIHNIIKKAIESK